MHNAEENPIFNGIYNSLPANIKVIVDLVPQLGSATVGPLLAGLIAENVNVTQMLGNLS